MLCSEVTCALTLLIVVMPLATAPPAKACAELAQFDSLRRVSTNVAFG